MKAWPSLWTNFSVGWSIPIVSVSRRLGVMTCKAVLISPQSTCQGRTTAQTLRRVHLRRFSDDNSSFSPQLKSFYQLLKVSSDAGNVSKFLRFQFHFVWLSALTLCSWHFVTTFVRISSIENWLLGKNLLRTMYMLSARRRSSMPRFCESRRVRHYLLFVCHRWTEEKVKG